MKQRWEVEYTNIKDFATACETQGQNRLWLKMNNEYDLIMGGVDFSSNYAYVLKLLEDRMWTTD